MRALLTVAVVLLAAAGFLLLGGHVATTPDAPEVVRDADGGDPTEPLREAPGEDGPGGAAAGTSDATRAPRAPRAAFPGIRGVVVDTQGRPLPGAGVRMEAFEVRELRGAAARSGRELARTRAGPDGGFELPLESQQWVRVIASHPGRGSVGTRVSGPGVVVRLELPLAASLEAEVLDARDAPVPGATVEASWRQAVGAGTSDAKGLARFDDVAPGAVVLQVRTADGRRARAGPVTVGAGEVRRVTLLLPDAVAVRGLVVEAETMSPIAGAEVHAAQPGLAFAAPPTGPDGLFGPLAAGAAGSRVTLAVRAPGYLPSMLPVLLPEVGTVLDLPPVVLKRGEDWRGRVVDAGGRPVPGARVAWTAAGIEGRDAPSAQTDADGRFTLPAPSPPAPGRRVLLAAEGPGGTAAHAFRPGSPPPADLVLVLAGGVSVSGRVVDAAGAGVAGVSVRLEPRWSEIEDRRRPGPETARLQALGDTARLALTAATDGQGWWRIDGVPDGIYDTRLLHAGSTLFNDQPLGVEGRDVQAGVVRLGDGHGVEGGTWDETGRPLAGVEVTLREAEGRPRIRRTVSDEEGRWRFETIAAGAWVVATYRPDLAPVRRPLSVPTDGAVDLEIGRGTRLAGRVLDPQGRPWRGAFTVTLEGDTGRDRAPGTTFRDADGRFVLEGVLPGTWTARVTTSRGGIGLAPAPVEVRPGAVYDVTIQLGAAATLTGTLGRADGGAVVGGRLALERVEGSRRLATATGSGGTFRVEGLDPGPWRIVARGPGGAARVQEVDLGVGETRRVDLVLGPVGSIAVTVRGADGGLRVGAYVSVRPETGIANAPRTPPRTDRQGRVVLEDVPLGACIVRVRTPSGERGRAEVVVGGEVREIEVAVRKDGR